MSKSLRHKNFSPTASAGAASRKVVKSSTGGSQVGDQTPSSVFGYEEDDLLQVKKRYQDVEERRLREWENYQKSHRSSLEQSSAKAFMDVSIGDVPAGRLVIELFEDTVPLTVENFRSLITGSSPYDPLEGTPKLDYLETCVYRIDKKTKCFSLGELQGLSIAATPSGPPPCVTLNDENFAVRHHQRGMLSMVARGPNTVGSAFCITTDAAPLLDFKQVVFAKVIDGIGVIEKIEAVATNRIGTPITPITVTFCGALSGAKPPGVFEPKLRGDVIKGESSFDVGSDVGAVGAPSAASADAQATTEQRPPLHPEHVDAPPAEVEPQGDADGRNEPSEYPVDLDSTTGPVPILSEEVEEPSPAAAAVAEPEAGEQAEAVVVAATT